MFTINGVTYDEINHAYSVGDTPIPSLTQMLQADGLSDHLNMVHPMVLKAKTLWGTGLHAALQKSEAGCEIPEAYKRHCEDWLNLSRTMKWGFWKVVEMPFLGRYEGLYWGFTPDRASPEAVVEFKGTASPSVSHHIQTALQVIGMGYSRQTPRYVIYFDKEGMKKSRGVILCGDTIERDGRTVNVWEEAERILFDHAVQLPEEF